MPRKRFYSNKANSVFYNALDYCCKKYKYVFCFNGNSYQNGFEQTIYASNKLLDINCLKQLDVLVPNKYTAFYLSYDLKNEIEDLVSEKNSSFEFLPLAILQADLKISKLGYSLEIDSQMGNLNAISDKILNLKTHKKRALPPLFTEQTNFEDYKNTVTNIQNNIIEGDVYEICYCIEFLDTNYTLDKPHQMFQALMKKSPTPFSSFVQLDTQFLISASPERFIIKKGNTIYSQPIKGTMARNIDLEIDALLKEKLKNSSKDISENLMIVDLVRNDLSKISKPASVLVTELFGIYSYPTVHQMTSTISSELNDKTSFKDIIQALFPMGSMTGAPKIKAMQLIEQYERFKRGIYSGSVGYFTTNGFDANVVIRSFQYNKKTNTLGYHVGSAITFESDVLAEYQECVLKSKAILSLFTNS